MTSVLIIIEKPKDLEFLQTNRFSLSDSKIFSFNYSTHKMLEKENISHNIAEKYLSQDEREKILDLAVSYHEWYKNDKFDNIEYEGVNILGLLDKNEFHELLMHSLLRFVAIKNIIEIEKPEKIITATTFAPMIKTLTHETKTIIIGNNNKSSDKLSFDKIDVPFKIGKHLLTISLSRNTYKKIKNFVELTICSVFSLWFKPNQKRTLLFLEFDPSSYKELLSNLHNYDKNVVFLNWRRSAIWNLDSIKTLYKYKAKVLNPNYFIDTKLRKKIISITNQFYKKLDDFWKDDQTFSKFFTIEGYSFRESIKEILINSYKNRLSDYIFLITLSKKIFEGIDVSCIICLNQSGETEKTILNVNNNRKPSILLEHAFINYTSDSQKYDFLSDFNLLHDKIAVWGDIQKQYLIEQRNFDPNKILVTGSPRHDAYFKNKKNHNNNSQKIILFTPRPINEISGNSYPELYEKFEKYVRNLCSFVKHHSNVEIVVKLHPSQTKHNEEIKILFNEIDPSIPIYQLTPIQNLLKSCDVLVNLSTEGWDPSTVVLEAMIFEKPIMEIVLDNKQPPMEFVKDEAVLVTFNEDELERNLNNLLFDTDLKNKLIQNGKMHLKRYLSYHGKSSVEFAKILNSY